ncbi:hypothetical protein HY772_01310 [Candidatus Woesearchaeota archaeon]|nr:hypothetical protein [Candidatus Woesearchaeota archaeon]
MRKFLFFIPVFLVMFPMVFAVDYYNPTGGSYGANAVSYFNGVVFNMTINNQVPVQINVSGGDCTQYGIWNFTGPGSPVGAAFITCTPDGNRICSFNSTGQRQSFLPDSRSKSKLLTILLCYWRNLEL